MDNVAIKQTGAFQPIKTKIAIVKPKQVIAFEHSAAQLWVKANAKKISESLEKQESKIRENKINKLKQQIDSGRYFVSSEEIARAILGE